MPHQDPRGMDLTAGNRERNLACRLFFLGASALVAQTLAIREILALAGGSEHILGMAFAFWFLWTGAGAWGAGCVRSRGMGRSAALATLLALGAAWLPLLQVLLLRWCAGWLETGDGRLTGTWRAAAALLVLLAPVPMALGALLTAAAAPSEEASQSNSMVARRLAWDALGATAAGTVFTFAFAGRLPSLQVGLLFPAIGSALTLWLTRGEPGRGGFTLGLAALNGVLSAALLYANRESDLEHRTFAWRPRFVERRERVIQTKDSRYQQLALTEHHGQYTVYGNGEPAAVYPDAEASALDAHLIACLAPAPRRILLAGGANGSVLAELLRHRPERLDVVECDLEALALLRVAFSEADRRAFEHPAVRIVEADAAAFLLAAPDGYYDLVWLHPPPPSSLLNNRFYTEEFFRRVARATAPRGVVVFTTLGAPNYLSPLLGAYLASIRAAAQASFQEILEFPGGVERFTCAKQAGVLPRDPEEAIARFRARTIAASDFVPESFYLAWEPEQVGKREEDLAAFAATPPNRDLEPRAMTSYLRLRDLLARGPEEAPPSQREWHPPDSRWILASLATLALAAILTRRMFRRAPERRRRGRMDFVALAGLAGAGGIALELALLNAYQAGCGYVYERIGLVSSVYLLGFAAGGRWAAHVLAMPASALRWLRAATCAQPVLVFLAWCAAGPLWPYLTPGAIEAATFVLLGAFSFAAGIQLPLLGPETECGSEQAMSWSMLLTGDMAGAALGSFLLGSVLLPLYGARDMLGILATALLIGIVWLPCERRGGKPEGD